MSETYKGWIITHDPLPLPKGHPEYDVRREDKTLWPLRAHSVIRAKQDIDRIERHRE